MTSALFLAVGLGLLIIAGDRLVTSAGRLALRLGLSAVVIGATVVAFGTSMPEFTVSLISALDGASGVAAGNVIGSNITNVLLVLGVAAVISPIAAHRRLLRFDIPLLLAVTLWALVIFIDGQVTRVEGALSVLALIAFTIAQLVWFSPKDEAAPEAGIEGLPDPNEGQGDGQPRVAKELPMLAVAVAGLASGSWLFVEGATTIAESIGISEFAIGATVVAIGTSLPELVTSAIAAWRRQDDIAIGNVVGSNMFNVLGVLGGAAAATPVALNKDLFEFEMPMLLVSAVVFFPLMWRRTHIGRTAGTVLLLGFIAFVSATLMRGS